MIIREFGNPRGRTLLMLHGGSVAGWMWGPQLPAFGDYRILVPDLPGFGASNHLPWHSTAETADALAAVLDGTVRDGTVLDENVRDNTVRDNTPAHVVGLSLGSSVALQLAARHPHLVASLFLASVQVAPPRRRDVLAGRLMLRAWNRRAFWVAMARAYGLRGDDAEQLIDTGLGIAVDTARTILDEVQWGIPGTLLAAVTAPTVAVAGSSDSVSIAVASLDAVRLGVPGSLTATAPGLHHQWNVEGPELFNSAVQCWLDDGSLFSGLHTHRG